MKRTLALCTILLCLLCVLSAPAPARADTKWLTAVPRAVGRTYVNMFTFKHPWLAIQQWAVFGANAYDSSTTYSAFHRCPGCVEVGWGNSFKGRQAGSAELILNTVMTTTYENALAQYGSEVISQDHNILWRNSYTLVPINSLVWHVRAGMHNSTIGVKK